MKRWLLALSLAGSLTVAAAEPRVVSLTWESTEHLLQLGITPLAVADAEDYRIWMVHPPLPDTVPSAGTRNEPSLELLARAHPDLIVIDPVLQTLKPALARITPVLDYPGFGGEGDNLARARANYLDLARHLQREPLAQQRLAALDAHLAQQRERLRRHFAGQPPRVTLIRFASPTTAYVFGANAMPQRALEQLGLISESRQPPSTWGITQVPITWLGSQTSVVLHIEPFAQAEQLFTSPLWKAMPFVRAGRFASLPPTWTYGGVFSVRYLADAIVEALLRLPGSNTSLDGRQAIDLHD